MQNITDKVFEGNKSLRGACECDNTFHHHKNFFFFMYNMDK